MSPFLRVVLLVSALVTLSCDWSQLQPKPDGLDDESFVRAVMSNDQKSVTRALAGEINPNAKNKHGDTALIWAVYHNDLELCKTLLARGADPNLAGAGEKTALHWAAEIGALDCLRALIEAGVNVNAGDRGQRTPLMAASGNFQGFAAEELLKHGADPDLTDRAGETALMYAVRKGNREGVELLVLAGASLDPVSKRGDSALNLAVKSNSRSMFETQAITEKYPNLISRVDSNIDTVIANQDKRPQFDKALITAIEARMNEQRRQFGLEPLVFDANLSRVSETLLAESKVNSPGTGLGGRPFGNLKGAYRKLSGNNTDFEVGMNRYQGRLYSGSSGVIDKGVRTIHYNWHDRDGLADQIVNYWTETYDRQNILNELTVKTGGAFVVDDAGGIQLAQVFYRRVIDSDLPILEPEKRPLFAPGALEQAIHDRVNQARIKAGLKAFAYDEDLAGVALEHATDVASRGIFYHITPAMNGVAPKVAAAERDHDIHENLYRTPLYSSVKEVTVDGQTYLQYQWLSLDELADAVVDGLFANKVNRANLLSPEFEQEGIGAHWYQGNQSHLYVTQNFFIYESRPQIMETVITNGEQRPNIDVAALAQELHRLVNDVRKEHKLNRLRYDEHVSEVARLHSVDMSKNGFVDHFNLRGESPMDRVKRYNLKTMKKVRYPRGIAENIHRGSLHDGQTIIVRDGVRRLTYGWLDMKAIAKITVDDWMKSEGHRANLLHNGFEYEGFGIYIDDKHHVYVTQNFL